MAGRPHQPADVRQGCAETMGIDLYSPPERLALVSLPPRYYREVLVHLSEVDGLVQLTRDAAEITLILAEDRWSHLATHFPEARYIGGRRLIQFNLTLDFAIIGFLAEVTRLLAAAGISVFAISTWRTDAVLVAEESFNKAVEVLSKAPSLHKIARME